MTEEASVQTFTQKVETILGSRGLDYLVNNAGVSDNSHYFVIPPTETPWTHQQAGQPDYPVSFSAEDFLSAFKINVLGPALLFKTLLPILERGSRKVIVNLSTRVGSISCAKEEFGDFCATYASCKAALNMFVSTSMRNLISQT